MKIKKIALVALILAFVMSCPNNEDSTINLVQKDLIFCGEELETRDSVTYIVKKYAELTLADCPYFYNYYKIYYLNDKIRCLEVFCHGIGCEMDCKYTEFVEHQCFVPHNEADWYLKVEEKYEFYEDGKKSSYFYLSGAEAVERHYAQNGNIVLEKKFDSEWPYNVDYNKWREYKYDDYGRLEYALISTDGVKQLKERNTYYSNGKCKSEAYSDGNLWRIEVSGVFHVHYYTSNNSVNYFQWYYPIVDNTSRTQYDYSSAGEKPNILITYDENGVVIEEKAYTDEEIKVFIQKLIDDYENSL